MEGEEMKKGILRDSQGIICTKYIVYFPEKKSYATIYNLKDKFRGTERGLSGQQHFLLL